ncbi:MAG: RsmB/NOP family class I SAM-dependent RNA methyltransferase [Deltaproteobacteria bacterium]|nr:RsmB/NOP family class I SAM-dependent RNA methyltransferase [Deltaproteobacteria bacterium]
MATKKAIRAALVSLDALAQGEPLRLAVSQGLRSESDLGPKERRWAASAAREVCRDLRRLDAFLAQAGLALRTLIPQDKSLARLLAVRLRVHGDDPKVALRELALPGPRRPRSISDAQLADVASKMPAELELPEDPIARRALQFSYPDWILQELADAIPQGELDPWLDANAAAPGLDLRVNLARAKPDDVRAELEKAGFAIEQGRFLPEALRCEDRAALFDTSAFKQGRIDVQDEASQLIVRLCGVSPGVKSLDFCAGAGGKSLALAALGARVTATDGIAARLKPLRERRKRAGAHIEIVDRAEGEFEVVLVDAPCSGLGALAREPDGKWRLAKDALAALPDKQLAILEQASTHVAKGGRLVYATCSPLPEEDERVVERFLAKHPDFSQLPPARTLGEALANRLGAEQAMRLWAHRHGTGSFFAALLARR